MTDLSFAFVSAFLAMDYVFYRARDEDMNEGKGRNPWPFVLVLFFALATVIWLLTRRLH